MEKSPEDVTPRYIPEGVLDEDRLKEGGAILGDVEKVIEYGYVSRS